MADQVAVALDNAELFARSEAALEAERRAYGEMSQEAWKELTQSEAIISHYIADKSGTARPMHEGKRSDSLQDQQSTAPLQATDQKIQDDGLTAIIPIKSHGKVLGGIKLSRSEDSGEWTQEQLALAQSVSEQMSTALESARLYQDIQRRAIREQTLSEMTARFSRSLDMDAVLQNAVRELGQLLDMDEISVYVGNPEEA
jgi:GAF domain-containing protein